MLGQRRRRRRRDRRARDQRPHQRVDGAEHGAVRHVDRQPGGRPAGAARDELAEQLDVVVIGPEDPLVERLLGRPDRGRRSARERPV